MKDYCIYDRCRRSLAEIFWEKVDKRGPDECWEWTASKIKGYGRVNYQRTMLRANRIAVYLATGEWPPDDKLVCHKCNNRGCVNPAHLYVGTHQDNMNDLVHSRLKTN